MIDRLHEPGIALREVVVDRHDVHGDPGQSLWPRAE